MKVAIDYSLAKGHIGGMGVFVRNLVSSLTKTGRENNYILIENPYDFDPKNNITKIISVIRQHSWYQTSILKVLQKKNVDLLYSPNPPVPLLFNKPLILTIPDMAFVKEPTIPLISKCYLFISYILAAHKSDKIITISEFSKKDIINILKVDPSKIEVIPLGVSNIYKNDKKLPVIKNTLKKFSINKPFILCDPGTFLPRKNVADLVTAFSKLPQNVRESLDIVLVGKDNGVDYENLKRFITELNLQDKIIFTGYLETEELVNLYRAAKIHVYPSLYEGFGLPPLQAMTMGIPTIVYNRTSLPEVVGNAGIKVNDTDEFKDAILSLLRNAKLYQKMKHLGLARSKQFSWEIAARKFNEIIRKYNN